MPRYILKLQTPAAGFQAAQDFKAVLLHNYSTPQQVCLTIIGRSSTYTSVLRNPGRPPPTNAALFSVIFVRVKLEQGGGLHPVDVMFFHFPAQFLSLSTELVGQLEPIIGYIHFEANFCFCFLRVHK